MVVLELAFFAALTASHLCFLADRVVAHRTVRGSSLCDACGSQLRLRDVVPLLPWLLRRGRAACCGVGLSRRYPLSELASGSWAAAWGVLVLAGEVGLAWAAVLALVGPGVSATRSYRAAMRAAGAGCHAHSSMREGGPGVHTFLGAVRCGWCASALAA